MAYGIQLQPEQSRYITPEYVLSSLNNQPTPEKPADPFSASIAIDPESGSVNKIDFSGTHDQLNTLLGQQQPTVDQTGPVTPNILQPQQQQQIAPVAPGQLAEPNEGRINLFNYVKDHKNPLTYDQIVESNNALMSGDPQAQQLHMQAVNQRQEALANNAINKVLEQAKGDAKTPEQANLNIADALKSGSKTLLNVLGTYAFGIKSEFGKALLNDLGVGLKYSNPGNYEVTVNGETKIIPNVQAQVTPDGLLTGKYLANGKEITIPPGATVRSISPSQKIVDQLADAGYYAQADEYQRTGKLPPGFYLPKEAVAELYKDDPATAIALMKSGATGEQGTGVSGGINFHSKAIRAKAAEVSTKLLDNVDISKDNDAAVIYRILSNPNVLSTNELNSAIQTAATLVSKNKLSEEQRKQIQEFEKIDKQFAVKKEELAIQSEIRKNEEIFKAKLDQQYGPTSAAAKKSAEVTAEAIANGYDVSPGHEPLYKQKAERELDSQSRREAVKEATKVYSTKSDIIGQQKDLNKAIDYLDANQHNIGSIISGVVGRGRIAQAIGSQFETEQSKNTKFILDQVNKLAVVGLKTLGTNPSTVDLEFWTKNKPDAYSSPEYVKEWITSHKATLERNLAFAEDTLKNKGKFPGLESTEEFVIKSVKPL